MGGAGVRVERQNQTQILLEMGPVNRELRLESELYEHPEQGGF